MESNSKMFDAIVISDLHLGSKICCKEEIYDFLQSMRGKTKKIILNGDVFDSHDFRRLEKKHWKILSLLRKMSDKEEIIWVVGNHDGPVETLSNLLGITVVDEYEMESHGKKILCLHGDIFDEIITNYPRLTKICDLVYRLFQRVDKNKNISRWLKKRAKIYIRNSEKVKSKAVDYAKDKCSDYVICGHTHKSTIDFIDKICYINSGCWTESPCNYVEIVNGNCNLKLYENFGSQALNS